MKEPLTFAKVNAGQDVKDEAIQLIELAQKMNENPFTKEEIQSQLRDIQKFSDLADDEEFLEQALSTQVDD